MLPLPVSDLSTDVMQLPARLFFDFPCESLCRYFARLHVATNDIPDTREDSACHRPPLDKHATSVIANQGAYTSWFTHAAYHPYILSREASVSLYPSFRQDNAGGEPRPEAGAQRTLEGVGSTARLCENPVFGACELYKLLILLGRIFKKWTFHPVSCVVRRARATVHSLRR